MTERVLAVLLLVAPGCITEPDPHTSCGAPRPLSELQAIPHALTPWMTRDRLEIFFTAGTPPDYSSFGIYRATRTSITAAFDPPAVFHDHDADGDVFDPTLSDDENTLWYVKGSGVDGGYVYQVTRDARDGAFGPEQRVFDALGAIIHPTLTGDRLHVFYAQRVASKGFDLFTADRPSTDTDFDPGQPLDGINSVESETSPTIAGDGSTLYFSSVSFSSGADVAQHIQHLGFATAADGFATRKVLTPPTQLAGTEDLMGWIDPLQKTIVFSSNRTGGPGSDDSLWIYCE